MKTNGCFKSNNPTKQLTASGDSMKPSNVRESDSWSIISFLICKSRKQSSCQDHTLQGRGQDLSVQGQDQGHGLTCQGQCQDLAIQGQDQGHGLRRKGQGRDQEF